jgi:hypothetical protein
MQSSHLLFLTPCSRRCHSLAHRFIVSGRGASHFCAVFSRSNFPRSRVLLPSLLPKLDLQFSFRGCHLVGTLFLSNAVLSQFQFRGCHLVGTLFLQCSPLIRLPVSLFQEVSLVGTLVQRFRSWAFTCLSCVRGASSRARGLVTSCRTLNRL